MEDAQKSEKTVNEFLQIKRIPLVTWKKYLQEFYDAEELNKIGIPNNR